VCGHAAKCGPSAHFTLACLTDTAGCGVGGQRCCRLNGASSLLLEEEEAESDEAVTTTLDPETECGHTVEQCTGSSSQVLFTTDCIHGASLGCMALGLKCCRYCGYGAFSSIDCGSSTTSGSSSGNEATVSTTEDPVTKCGHTTDCGSQAYFTISCYNGGLGCSALGLRCCKYCGFGAYISTTCPDSTTTQADASTSAAAATTTSTVTATSTTTVTTTAATTVTTTTTVATTTTTTSTAATTSTTIIAATTTTTTTAATTTTTSTVTTTSTAGSAASSATTAAPADTTTTTAVEDAEAKCGHSTSDCGTSSTIFFTVDCYNGGLGCSALGYKCCRYCGFNDFVSITCPDSTTAAVAATTGAAAITTTKEATSPATTAAQSSTTTAAAVAATTTEDASVLCGHSTDCQSSQAFFTIDCLYGGLGCSAMGLKCCRYCGFDAFINIVCPDSTTTGVPTSDSSVGTTAAAATIAATTTTVAVTVSTTTTTTQDISACGHTAAACSCSAAEPCLFTTACLSGGLGCSALGLSCCRFCEFGSFSSISCEREASTTAAIADPPSSTVASTTAGVIGTTSSISTTTEDLSAQCGHEESVCASAQSFFTTDCLNGGLGCSAYGYTCCRMCSSTGTGTYASIVCPSTTTTTVTTTTVTTTTVTTTTTTTTTFNGTTTTTTLGTNLLEPISLASLDSTVLPNATGHYYTPASIEIGGPIMTNKFWGNWLVSTGTWTSIYPMPYVIKWGHTAGDPPALKISHGSKVTSYQSANPERLQYYYTSFVTEFALGASEDSSSSAVHTITKQQLFGIHTTVSGADGYSSMTFPIYSGMAYVSAQYSNFTPQLTSDRAITNIEQVSGGIFSLSNNGGREFRMYVLDNDGNFVDTSYTFSDSGTMNQKFFGWIRLAEVTSKCPTDILDAHAQAIVTGMTLDVREGGRVSYKFETAGSSNVELLHFAYNHTLAWMENAGIDSSRVTAAKIIPPTKGIMTGILGDEWVLQVDLTEAENVDFLPSGEVTDSDKIEWLAAEALGTYQWFQSNWESAIYLYSYYYSGKGFQKIGMVCLMLEKFYGIDSQYTQGCADILATAFECFYEAGISCNMPGLYYDKVWGGIVTRLGYDTVGCLGGSDFGNACYNDHHYHYGYFVVAAATLVKLQPEMVNNTGFVNFINAMIRDTTNPSEDDALFPMFRSFDWFDMHSWSRGLPPSADGKDQESTSEEVNLVFGLRLWGKVTGNYILEELGTTMLALASTTIKTYFLMQNDNTYHPADFVTNHATGIFFQNKADYATWFGANTEYIHGIQMLPLSPAMQLTRTTTFCREEWDDILEAIDLSATDPWRTIVLSGNLAIIDPDTAYDKISATGAGYFDDGLTRVWASYWAACQPGENV